MTLLRLLVGLWQVGPWLEQQTARAKELAPADIPPEDLAEDWEPEPLPERAIMPERVSQVRFCRYRFPPRGDLGYR